MPLTRDASASTLTHQPFYAPADSRPWLMDEGERVAALHSHSLDGSVANLLLTEAKTVTGDAGQRQHINPLATTPPFLFLLAADDQADMQEEIAKLEEIVASLDDRATTLQAQAAQIFGRFQERSGCAYALALVGANKERFSDELRWAR